MSSQLSTYQHIKNHVLELSEKYGRALHPPLIIAVSKTRTIAEISSLVALGQQNFGENYLQEALPKIHALKNSQLVWHYIGRIQSNKTAEIAQNFDWVHTVDRCKVAERLNEQRPPEFKPLNICIQVNISGEASKSGITLDELPELYQKTQELARLCVRGLMTLPAPRLSFLEQRQEFHKLAKALSKLKENDSHFDSLSMGTSDDYEAAIAEGATHLRIGTAIFGQRNKL